MDGGLVADVGTAGAYVVVDGLFVFMVGIANAGRDRLVVVRLGGHREGAETAWQCAAREVHEEAGLRIRAVAPPHTYWTGPEADASRLEVEPWPAQPGEEEAPLLVAWRMEAEKRRLSVNYLARSEGPATPGNEAAGLLLLRPSEVLRLVRGPVTLREYLGAGGLAVLREQLPADFVLEPFLQLRVLAALMERHPTLATSQWALRGGAEQ